MVRVTNSMMVNTLLRNLNNNAARMSTYQTQLSSELKINKLSDDPLGVITSLRARNSRNNLTMYESNLDSANAWMTAGETALMEVNELVKSMYIDAIDMATDAKTSYDRKITANKVREYRDELVQALNSTLMDKYLFGGYNSLKEPFRVENGSLYYNDYRMDAYSEEKLNFEYFQSNMADIMLTAVEDSMAATPPPPGEYKEKTVEILKEIQSAVGQMLNAATNASKMRGFTQEDIISAMQTVRDYNELVKNPPVTQITLDALDAVIDMASFKGIKADQIPESPERENLLMKNLGMLSAVTSEMVKTAEDSAFMPTGIAKEIRDLVVGYDKESKLAATYPELLAKEGEKTYDIIVGFGLTMDVCMNGVDIVGTGANNLYKVLDDMYNALVADYVDYSYSNDYITSEALSSIEDYVGKIIGDTVNFADNAEKQTRVSDILTNLQEMIQAGLKASEVTEVYTVKDASGNTIINTEGRVDLAEGYWYNFLDKTVRDGDGQVVIGADGSVRGNLASTNGTISEIILADGTVIEMDVATGAISIQTALDLIEVTDANGNLLDSNGDPIVDKNGVVLNSDYTKLTETVTMSASFIQQAMYSAADPNWSTNTANAAENAMIGEIKQIIADFSAKGATVEEITNALKTMYDSVSGLATEIGAINDTTDPAFGNLMNTAAKTARVSAAKTMYDASTTIPTDSLGKPIGYRTEGSRAEDITPFIGKLQKLQNENLALIAVYGGRCNRCEVLANRYSIDQLNYTQRISNVEDADTAEVIMYLKMAESVYNAALSAGARIIQPSLMDFMR